MTTLYCCLLYLSSVFVYGIVPESLKIFFLSVFIAFFLMRRSWRKRTTGKSLYVGNYPYSLTRNVEKSPRPTTWSIEESARTYYSEWTQANSSDTNKHRRAHEHNKCTHTYERPICWPTWKFSNHKIAFIIIIMIIYYMVWFFSSKQSGHGFQYVQK